MGEPPAGADRPRAGDQDDPTAGGEGDNDDARHAAAGGGTNLLAIIAGLVLPVYHGLVARLYGAGTYGLYALGLGVTDIIARLGAVGTDKGLLRHIPYHRVAGEHDLARRSLSTAFWLSFGGAAALSALAVLFAGPLATLQRKPETELAIQLLAPSTPFASLIVVLISATMAAKVMRYNLFVRGLGQPLLLLAVAVPVAFFSPTLGALCVSHLIATVLTALWALWAVKRVFCAEPLWRQLFAGPAHWEMVRFALPMGMSEFLNAVLQRADLILLGLWVPKVGVGIYAGAELLSRAVSNARYAFDPVASPVLSEALRQGDNKRLAYNLQLMTRWVMLLTFPIIGFVLGFRQELLGLFGEAFLAAGTAFLVLNAGHLFNGMLGLTGWVLAMSGRSDLILVNNLLASGLNIGLCFLVIPRHGILGAAIASAISVTFSQVLQLIEVGWIQRVHPFGLPLLRVSLAGAVTVGLMLVVGGHLIGPAWLRITYGTVAMVICYGALLAAVGLPTEEREIVGRFAKKLLRRR